MSMRDASAIKRPDYWLLGIALALVGFGLVMVYSSSGIMAESVYENKYYFFERQAVFAAVGLLVMLVCAYAPRRLFYDLNYLWLMVALGLIVLTLLSNRPINGSRRWVSLGFVSVQPLELAKLALVFYLAYFFANKQSLVKTFSVGFLPPFIVTGLFCGLLMLQPDFGGAMTLAMLLFLMCLVGGTRLVYLMGSLLFGAGSAYLLIVNCEYRFKRWLIFLNPFDDPKNSGYQLVQSFYALGSGDWFGAGLGAGRQKLFYLPEAHNDFIMAVVGEEAGFIGLSIVFLLIGGIVYRGFRIALAQEPLQDRFTAYGTTLILALGFFLNLAVVLGAVPPKGVAMPLISYGGSNLIASMACVGVLLNLSRGAR